jgi:iron complex outermembrane receptor protein
MRPRNLGKLKTSGIDLSAFWRSGATSSGMWGVGFEGTYILEYKYQREKGGDFINAKGKYTDNAPVFKWQHVLTATWAMGPWSAVFAQRYKTGYTRPGRRQQGQGLLDPRRVGELRRDQGPGADGRREQRLRPGPAADRPEHDVPAGLRPALHRSARRSFLLRASYKFF